MFNNNNLQGTFIQVPLSNLQQHFATWTTYKQQQQQRWLKQHGSTTRQPFLITWFAPWIRLMEDASSVKDFRFGLGRHLTKSRRTSNPARRHHVSSSVGEIILSSPSIGRLWFAINPHSLGLFLSLWGRYKAEQTTSTTTRRSTWRFWRENTAGISKSHRVGECMHQIIRYI